MKTAFLCIALICALLLDTSSAAPFAEGSRTRRDVPAQGCSSYWTIRSGSTCWDTARICGISLSTLYRYNRQLEGGRTCDNLQIGKILCCEYDSGYERPAYGVYDYGVYDYGNYGRSARK